MNSQAFYAPIVNSMDRKVAEDGSFRGARHGVFTVFVEQAGSVLAGLPEGTYDVRAIAKMAGTPGWAARVAARKLAAVTDDATCEVHAGGRGHATIVQIRF